MFWRVFWRAAERKIYEIPFEFFFFFAKGSPFCKGSDEYRSSLFKFRKIKAFIDNVFSWFPSLVLRFKLYFLSDT